MAENQDMAAGTAKPSENTGKTAIDTAKANAEAAAKADAATIKEADIIIAAAGKIKAATDPEKAEAAARKVILDRKALYKEQSIGVVIFSGVVFGLTILGYLNKIFWLAFVCVVVVDVYLIIVLFIGALKSDEHKSQNWPGNYFLPNKAPGLVVIALLLLSLIAGFAEILSHHGLFNGRENAFYSTFISITSFDYTNYSDKSRTVKIAQMCQSVSALLIITAAFGLLLSRISDYKDKEE